MTQQLLAAKNAAQRKVEFFRLLFFPGVSVDSRPLSRQEFWELLKIFFGAITFASVMIAVLSFWFQRSVIEQEYQWRHMKEAQDILKEWDQHTGAQKARIESFFRRQHRWNTMQTITREDAEALLDALGPDPSDESPSEWWKVRLEVAALLNYFETISTASLRGIADEQIMRESLGDAMIAWRRYLQPYTDLIDAQQQRAVWQPYYELIARWTDASPAGKPGSRLLRDRKPSHARGSFERR